MSSLERELTRSKEHLKVLQAELREAMDGVEEAEAGLEEVQCMIGLIQEGGIQEDEIAPSDTGAAPDNRSKNRKRKMCAMSGEQCAQGTATMKSVAERMSVPELVGRVSAQKEAQLALVEARLAELRSELCKASREQEEAQR